MEVRQWRCINCDSTDSTKKHVHYKIREGTMAFTLDNARVMIRPHSPYKGVLAISMKG